MLDHISEVSSGIDRLSRLALNGRIELASVPDAGSIRTLFSDVERQVEDARSRLTTFDSIEAAAGDLRHAAEHPATDAPVQLRASAETPAWWSSRSITNPCMHPALNASPQSRRASARLRGRMESSIPT